MAAVHAGAIVTNSRQHRIVYHAVGGCPAGPDLLACTPTAPFVNYIFYVYIQYIQTYQVRMCADARVFSPLARVSDPMREFVRRPL